MSTSSLPLAGRVVLITGAGRGLGRAHALACAALGARIVVSDIGAGTDGSGCSADPANAVAQEIRDLGGEAIVSLGDVTDPTAAAAMVEFAVERFGALHCLVNNAGILRDKTILNMSVEDWDAVVRVHLRGAFVMTQAAGRYWRDQAKGGQPQAARIVNTTSGSGLYGSFGQANYSAAKGGIASLTATAAIELAGYGVTVNAVAPVARTRLVPQAKDEAASFDPLDPANVSPLIAWLASERSGGVTGRIFSAVGGYVGVVEGYNRGPELLLDRQPTFADLDAGLPAVLQRAKPRTVVRQSHPYVGGA